MPNIELPVNSAADDNATVHHTARRTLAPWQYGTLGAILLLSILLNFFHLGQNSFGDITTSVNSYYAAAVKSMLLNWHNFFFAAFDPQGFLAIDKPPLGFWIQVASAKVFGFSAWSLLLPEALAGVGAVAVLFVLVRRVFGPTAGLIAALALALTPISVIASRNNTIDSLLMLTLLLAAWALSIAVETGRVRWLLLSALLVGLGFNIKMLEAYVVLPAFTLTYLLCAPRRLPVRLLHLILAGVLLLVVSFAWITAVDLVPTTQRPYVASTQHDCELELALGYNGVSRAFGIGSNTTSGSGASSTGTAPKVNATGLLVLFGILSTGIPGPLRLLGPLLGGQIGWLLLFALWSLLVVRWRRPKQPGQPSLYQPGLTLWVTWFVTLLLFFSFALFDHAYYLVTFSPAICALVGIGMVALYQAYGTRTGWRSWLLPFALLTTALVQGVILAAFPAWRHRLTPLIVGLSLLIAVLLLVARLVPRLSRTALTSPLVVVGLLVLLIAPTVWAVLPLRYGVDTINPVAGPPLPVNILVVLAHEFLPESAHAQPALTHYLLAHQGQARYLVAGANASTVAPFILDTGQAAMALGGFTSFDSMLTVQQVATLVQQGQVRFFLLPSFAHLQLPTVSPRVRKEIEGFLQPGGKQGASVVQPAITQWVTAHCTLVPRATVEPGTTGPSDTVDLGEGYTLPTHLFDCGTLH